MKIANLEKLETSINNELEELNGLLEMNANLLNDLEAGSEEHVQLTRQQNKLRGRHRGLRQALTIANELAVEL